MLRASFVLVAGVAAALGSPASAQSFTRSATAITAYAPAGVEAEPRFPAPALAPALAPPFAARSFEHRGLFANAPDGFGEGAMAISPSGQRVYYLRAPAPRVQVARAYGEPDERIAAPTRGIDPRFLRQEVAYDGPHRPGTVVINSTERFLYLVMPGGRAMRYGIGVGREGFGWRGEKTITRMAEWPDWRPPPEMLRRRPDLPRFMPGGPSNPLGARALYLGDSLYRIHGTNEPHTIGQAVSSGCFRMMNEDVTDLYNRVRVGARVIVL